MPTTLVTTSAHYSALLSAVRRTPLVAVDLETTGLDALTESILLLALSCDGSTSWVVPWPCVGADMLDALAARVCIAHNANFEYKFLTARAPLAPQRWWCTQVAEGLIQAGLRGEEDEARVSLAEVREKYLRLGTDKTLQTSFVGLDAATFVPTPEQVAYAGQDVEGLHQIMAYQLRRLEREGMLRVSRLEMAVLPALADMELHGFLLDRERHAEVLRGYVAEERRTRALAERELRALFLSRRERENAALREQYEAFQERILGTLPPKGRQRKDSTPEAIALAKELRQERDKRKPLPLDFNLNSSQQVWAALAEGGTELYKVEWDNETADYATKPTTDKIVVKEAAARPGAPGVLRDYAAWAKAHKVVGTYGEGLAARVHPLTGRVHTEYNQNVQSGRTSSRKPNMQNMPPDIRACFRAGHGRVLVVADAKNQEGRLAAALSGDEHLLRTFRDGIDWHSQTAALAYPEQFPGGWRDVAKESPERAGCKNANFSGIYGGTPNTLVARGYVPNLDIGKRLMDAAYAFAPRLRAFTLETAEQAVEEGWVATASGRRRYFSLGPKPPYQKNGKPYRRWAKRRGGIRRAAMNHPIQGSGADVMKQAMVFLRRPMRELGGLLVAMVHDELVYEVPEARAGEARVLVEGAMLRAAACFIEALPIPAESKVTTWWEK